MLSTHRAPRRGRSRRSWRTLAAGASIGVVLVAAPAATAATTSITAWGSQQTGKLGNGVTLGTGVLPTSINGADGATAVASAPAATFIVTPAGVLGAGSKANAQLGVGNTTGNQSTFALIPGTEGAVGIAAATSQTLVLKSDGTVWGFGQNTWGTADGSVHTSSGATRVYVPTQIAGLSGITAVSAGRQVSLALKADGTVWAWGAVGTLGLGNPTTTAGATPVPVTLPAGRSAVSIAAGYRHALALLDDGTVVSWGNNSAGQLGIGTDDSVTPTDRVEPGYVNGFAAPPADGQPRVVGVSAGLNTSFAVLSDGTFRAWGSNVNGALGLATGTADQNVLAPTAPNAAASAQYPSSPVVQISAGNGATWARTQDGRVYAWGTNAVSQLGGPVTHGYPYGATLTGSETATEVPQRVGVLRNVPWLALGTDGTSQIVQTDTTLQGRRSSAEHFRGQSVGTIGPSHKLYFDSFDLPSTIVSLTIQGANPDDFVIVSAGTPTFPYTFPYTIAANAGVGFGVRFAPTEEGDRFATLVVATATQTAFLPIDGYGEPFTGGPSGKDGKDGEAGPAGRDGVSIVGPAGPTGPKGKDGVVSFTAKKATTSVKRGRTVTLRFALKNATAGRLATTTATATLPKALRAVGKRSIRVGGLSAGKSRTVTLSLKIGRKAALGTRTVKLRIPFGSKAITTTAKVKVTR